MRKVILEGLLLVACATVTGRSNATPPPPPPDFVDSLARRLLATPTIETFDDYAAAFATDLLVRSNGKAKVKGKDDWLAAERRRLGRIDRRVLTYAESGDAVLIVDQVDDRSDVPDRATIIADPRYATRAIRYAIGADHLVHAVDIVQADGFPRKP